MVELLRPLAWLEPFVDVLRLGAFLLFVALGLLAARASRRGTAGASRGSVDRLVVYFLVVSGAVGLVQIESWPFSNWALVHGLASPKGTVLELEGVDASGRGYLVDYRVLQPLAPEEFTSWLRGNFGRIGPGGREGVARFVLRRAEGGRRRFLAGGRVAPNERLLGPLAAPYHFLLPAGKTWRDGSAVPGTPFVGLRIWAVEWDVEERFRDPSRVARRLLVEVRDAAS